MNIGEIINYLRLDRELTLEDVGNYVGVGKSTVQKWEHGFIENMKRDKIALLSEILCVSPVTFITGEIVHITNVEKTLTSEEELIITRFRKLNKDGKDYIHKQFDFAKTQFEFSDCPIVFNMAARNGKLTQKSDEDIEQIKKSLSLLPSDDNSHL